MAGEYQACSECMEREEPLASFCTPGRYVGTWFMPSYYPNAASACGLLPLYGGLDVSGELEFTLGRRGSPNEEFVTVVEAESCFEAVLVSGMTNGGPDASLSASTEPLRTAFSGKVNCSTGEFEAEMYGAYHSVALCNLGVIEDWYPVKGKLTRHVQPPDAHL